MGFFARLARAGRDRNAVASMSARELADLGVSREDAVALTALPDDVPGRVAAMGRVFGLNEPALTDRRDTWNELLQSCHQCRELPACARLMALPGSARPQDADFCPNAQAFTTLAR